MDTGDLVSRSATETVMSVMQEFSNSEPIHVVITWTDEAGFVHVARNTNASTIQTLGLLQGAIMYYGGYLGQD